MFINILQVELLSDLFLLEYEFTGIQFIRILNRELPGIYTLERATLVKQFVRLKPYTFFGC